MASKPRIGIIGDGNVGSALEEGLSRAGYEVEAVGKEPARVKAVAQRAEVIVLAVPWSEAQNAIREMDGAYQGKPLVDVTNVMDDQMQYALDFQKSGAERIQEWARGAKVVKAFNTVFAQNMSAGALHGERLTALIAGDDEGAKRKVEQMARDVGFDVVDAGPSSNAKLLETLGALNIQLGYARNLGPAIGFKLVHAGNAAGSPRRETESRRA